jgi:hypothetical protein
MRKGTPNEKFNDHTRIYSDGSNKEEKVGYAVVTDQQSTRRRIRDQSSIFSAKQEAIIDAIQKLPTTGFRGVKSTTRKIRRPERLGNSWINEKEM